MGKTEDSGDTNSDVTSKKVPGWLKLQFTTAANKPYIDSFLKDVNDHNLDPQSYVLKRKDDAYEKALANGAAYLEDGQGHAYSYTAAYRILHKLPNGNKEHQFTEIGTTLTLIPGFQTALVVVTATALKEWWQAPPKRMIAANIKASNIPSQKTFDKLSWHQVYDGQLRSDIGHAYDTTLEHEKDHFATKSNGGDKAPGEDIYHMTPISIIQMAQVLLDFMDKGELYNKHTNETIKLDLSELEAIGLTRQRLEAISHGQLSKKILKSIPDTPPKPPESPKP